MDRRVSMVFAILSKTPIEEVITGLPGNEEDVQARYLEAVISTEGHVIRVASIYLPNGNPVESEKYPYKIKWMSHLKEHIKNLLSYEEAFVMAGDYNVIPTEEDVHDPEAWADDALFLPKTRYSYREILNLGLTDAFRACNGVAHQYTFWGLPEGRMAKRPWNQN